MFLIPDDLRMIADDIGAVSEALIELLRQEAHCDLARAPAPKFAKLTALWAARRGNEPLAVVDLFPQPTAVLHLAATALSDIEVFLRTTGVRA